VKKSQSGFEYILVVGIAMLLIVPGAILFYHYSSQSGDEMIRSQIDSIGHDIIDSAEKIYYIGANSWETINENFPENVRRVYINNNPGDFELVIEYDSHVGVSEAVFFSDVNITAPPGYGGSISDEVHAGLNVIKVTSLGDHVLINETR